MKTLALAVATALVAIAPLAQAQTYGNYDRPYNNNNADRYDRDRGDWRDTHARVLDSHPVYAQAGTHEECWNDDTHRYEHRGVNAGGVIGAIAGGVLGHQIGNGRGNDLATGAGAIAGGLAGNRIEQHRQDERASGDTRCRTVSDSDGAPDQVVAYDVRYEYRGREFTTRLNHEPGRWLAVGQDIRDDGYPFEGNVAYDRR